MMTLINSRLLISATVMCVEEKGEYISCPNRGIILLFITVGIYKYIYIAYYIYIYNICIYIYTIMRLGFWDFVIYNIALKQIHIAETVRGILQNPFEKCARYVELIRDHVGVLDRTTRKNSITTRQSSLRVSLNLRAIENSCDLSQQKGWMDI